MLAVLDRRLEIAVSTALMMEYEAVLTGPEQLAATGLSVDETSAVLDALAAVAKPVVCWFLRRPQLQDPADEMVLETTVNGQAHCIVTFNLRHLKAAGKFGIRVVTPPVPWKEISSHEKK